MFLKNLRKRFKIARGVSVDIPFFMTDISDEEINEVVDTLRSGWLTTGMKTKRFEREIADYCGVGRAVCLNSATASMEMVLRLFGVGCGDEVITSAYTYTASASVIAHTGAKIVLVDTAPGSFEMDYDALKKAITPNTKVIIPVDIGGVMCDYARILEIAEDCREFFTPNSDMQKNLGRILVLADAAHSFGARRDGIRSGVYADFSSFSFHAVKNLTTGEGGAITWKPFPGMTHDEIYNGIMLISLHGQTKDALAKTKPGSWEYDILIPAYKCNMPDVLASIGLAQLKRYDGLLQTRVGIAKMYDAFFEGTDIVPLKHYGENFESCRHLYLVNLSGKDEAFRNNAIVKLAEAGISANVHFKPLPILTAYKNLGFDINDYPNAYKKYENLISLPFHTFLTPEQVEFVAETLLSLMK